MDRRNIVATIVVLVLFAIIGYVVLSRTNILGLLRRPAVTPTPAPLGRDVDSDVNLGTSPTPFPLLFPTATPSGTIRPLATASPVAQCGNLTATPTSGTAPLTVRFTASGLPASVAQYEFNFGTTAANNVVKTANVSATFTYENAGTYNASLKAFDAQGTQITSLQNCFRTIAVLARPGATGTPNGTSLPKTGPESALLLLFAPLAGVGAYIYKKFKLL